MNVLCVRLRRTENLNNFVIKKVTVRDGKGVEFVGTWFSSSDKYLSANEMQKMLYGQGFVLFRGTSVIIFSTWCVIRTRINKNRGRGGKRKVVGQHQHFLLTHPFHQSCKWRRKVSARKFMTWDNIRKFISSQKCLQRKLMEFSLNVNIFSDFLIRAAKSQKVLRFKCEIKGLNSSDFINNLRQNILALC